MFLAEKDKNWPESEKVGRKFFSLCSFSYVLLIELCDYATVLHTNFENYVICVKICLWQVQMRSQGLFLKADHSQHP